MGKQPSTASAGGSATPGNVAAGGENKRASTRITKAFARFMGKEGNVKRTNSAVDMGELTVGRLGLPMGRFGRVIGLFEDELSTVIAYSLTSHEYADQIQAFLREDTGDVMAGGMKGKNELSSPADFSEAHHEFLSGYVNQQHNESRDEFYEESRRRQTSTARDSDFSGATHENRGEGAPQNTQPTSTVTMPVGVTPATLPIVTKRPTFNFQSLVKGGGGGGGSGAMLASSPTDKPQKDPVLGNTDRSGSEGLDPTAEREDADDPTAPQALSSLAFVGFNSSSMSFKSEKSKRGKGFLPTEHQDSSDTITPQPGLLSRRDEGEGGVMEDAGPRRAPRGGSGVMINEDGTSMFTENYDGCGSEDGASTTSNCSVREAVLTSQRKTHIKHRFSDMDDKNNITCKFICHTFWATQFQALRAEYLDDDEDEGYILSLSLAAR